MATIIDVAKLAGVGIGSVSRVINGKESVSDKTKLKVNKAIKALNYKPNNSARSLVSKKFNTIGIWGTELAGTFNSQTLRIIDHELITHGKHCLVTNGGINTRENPNAAIDSVDDLIQKGCDGIIFWGTDISPFDIAHVERYFPNIVLLNNRVKKLNQKCFYFDHYKAGYIAGQHLVDNGHKSIACITGDFGTEDGRDRHEGFLDSMKDNNITMPSEFIVEGDYSFIKGQEGILTLLKKNLDFTALFCGNDRSAMSAIATLSSSGYNIPNDISVIGYDDNEMASFTSPPLSTIRVPFDDMALAAVRYLLNTCYDLKLSVEHNFPVELIERKSVRNLT
ncbi:MAG: LacI family transcriptional regulator [Gammaproteobacteria bacterium]|nr:LacI family transcriptional regulator [Gammaproteobacteria bacterium]